MRKLNSTIFVLEDRKITKTTIVGTQQTLEWDHEKGKQITVDRYMVQLDTGTGRIQPNPEWVTDENIYDKLETAQAVIAERIQEEIIKEQSRVVVVDATGPLK